MASPTYPNSLILQSRTSPPSEKLAIASSSALFPSNRQNTALVSRLSPHQRMSQSVKRRQTLKPPLKAPSHTPPHVCDLSQNRSPLRCSPLLWPASPSLPTPSPGNRRKKSPSQRSSSILRRKNSRNCPWRAVRLLPPLKTTGS